MRVVSILGARPQFVKFAPLARALARSGGQIESRLVHTGQHYDRNMSDLFFEELDLPQADYHLGVGSGRHGAQTGQMLARIEEVLLESSPDIVIVYGDTNSTLAGALAAAKLGVPVAHVEAGLRSFNRAMPEELNRVASDHLSELLLAPTPTAVTQLQREGLGQRTVYTGDIMLDAVQDYRERALAHTAVFERLGVEPGRYALATVHRAENTDDPERLVRLLGAFEALAAEGVPVLFPMHPRTAKRLSEALPDWSPGPRLKLAEPLGYLDTLCLLAHARVALTDSGGLQKEAFFLGCPCVTLREETEWPETVQSGGNVLVGADARAIAAAVAGWFSRPRPRPALDAFGDGNAADRVVQALCVFHSLRKSR